MLICLLWALVQILLKHRNNVYELHIQVLRLVLCEGCVLSLCATLDQDFRYSLLHWKLTWYTSLMFEARIAACYLNLWTVLLRRYWRVRRRAVWLPCYSGYEESSWHIHSYVLPLRLSSHLQEKIGGECARYTLYCKFLQQQPSGKVYVGKHK